jgi:hypothetical protein
MYRRMSRSARRALLEAMKKARRNIQNKREMPNNMFLIIHNLSV